MANQFDLRTHHINNKGKVIRETPYRLVLENGTQRFEQPPGSGIWFDPQGNIIQQPAEKLVAAPAVEEKPVAVDQAMDAMDSKAKKR